MKKNKHSKLCLNSKKKLITGTTILIGALTFSGTALANYYDSLSKPNSSPTIQSETGIYLKGGFFNPQNSDVLLNNVTAIDAEDGDLTSKITYELFKYSKSDSSGFLPISTDSFNDLRPDDVYKIIYTVSDSNGNTTSNTNYLIGEDVGVSPIWPDYINENIKKMK